MRRVRHFFYRWLPSWTDRWHAKRRKGLQSKWGGRRVLECQQEQDRIFWERILQGKTSGVFWEIDAGDGTTGSHGLYLEGGPQWKGLIWEKKSRPARHVLRVRPSGVCPAPDPISVVPSGPCAEPDLVILRRTGRVVALTKILKRGTIRPSWLVIQAPQAKKEIPRLLSSVGYRMVWAFHDDEYYQRSRT